MAKPAAEVEKGSRLATPNVTDTSDRQIVIAGDVDILQVTLDDRDRTVDHRRTKRR